MQDADPPKRRRRSPEERLAAAREAQEKAAGRLARKARQVEKYEAAQTVRTRKLDTRRKIIAGAIALEHMRHDPEWRAKFRELLNTYVTKIEERSLFGLDPIPGDAPATAAPQPVADPQIQVVTTAKFPIGLSASYRIERKPDGFRELKKG